MKIPESITFNGMTFPTKYNPTLLADRERYGEFCGRLLDVTLDSNLSPQRTALSYCHELVEIIVAINHLDIEDESAKQAIGMGIYQIIQQADKFKDE